MCRLMNVSLWPVGVHQQELAVHQQSCRRLLLLSSRRVLQSPRRNTAEPHLRSLAQASHVADPAVAPGTEPVAQPAASNGVSSNGTISPSTAYPFTDIEAKWRHHWLQNKTFATPDIAELDTSKPKFYALDM